MVIRICQLRRWLFLYSAFQVSLKIMNVSLNDDLSWNISCYVFHFRIEFHSYLSKLWCVCLTSAFHFRLNSHLKKWMKIRVVMLKAVRNMISSPSWFALQFILPKLIMTQSSLKKDCFVFEGIVVVEINGPINIRVFKKYLTT